PVDFSDASRSAMEFACDLARHYQAEVTLLHVYQVPHFVLPDGVVVAGPETVSNLMSKIESALAAARERGESLGAVHASTLTEQGTPFVEIVRIAKDGYDLIVMGTHGRTGIRHALLGSVAEKVVRKAPCAVLTVRTGAHPFEHP